MSPRTKIQFEQIRKSSKDKILAVAMHLFAKNGYHATSISQIAKKANISKGLMYNYFASKEKLLDEIITNGFDALTKLEYTSGKNIPPQVQLEKFIDNVLENLYANFNYWQLYLNLLVHPSIQKKYEKLMIQFRDEFIKYLSAILKKIGRQNPKLDAFMLGTFFDGLVLNFIAAQDLYSPKEIKNALLESLSNSNSKLRKK